MPSTISTDPSGRYIQLIQHLLRGEPTLETAVENEQTICVERAGVLEFPRQVSPEQLRSFVDPLMRTTDNLAAIRIVDRNGQFRTHYRGLMAYGWLCALAAAESDSTRAFRETSQLHARAWCESFVPQFSRCDLAGLSSGIASAAWQALAVAVGGEVFQRKDWIDRGSDFFHRLASHQDRAGGFVGLRASEHPETTWFYELVILHAVAAFAARTGNPGIDQAVRRATEFHLNEIQPDHATAEPWGLLAFICNPNTYPLADQLLHNVQVQGPGGPTGVTRILLADTLQYLRLGR